MKGEKTMALSYRDERGAVLVHVTIALIGMLAMTALTFDAGIKWVARRQAQNAADAGALAGAVALSFDDPTDLSDTGLAKQSAQSYALANLVWGQAPDVQISTDITFPPCPDLSTDTCIKVDVYRNQLRGNPLPTFFASLVGVMNQGVRATATAQVQIGYATDCLKPWAIVDRWDEYAGAGDPNYPNTLDPDWTPASTFDKYEPRASEPDLYVPPSETSAGTGWSLSRDYGRLFGIRTDPPGNNTVSSGWYRSLDLPRVDTANLGGNAYGANIVSCNGYPVRIAAPETVCPEPSAIATFEDKVMWAARGCVRVQTGIIQGQTIDGIEEIYNRDPAARWDQSMNEGRGGIATTFTPTPRIVPIAVMDIDRYLAADPSGSGGIVKVVNIFGFFIEGMGDIAADGTVIFNPDDPMNNRNKVVVGRVVTLPSLAVPGSGNINEDAAFLKTILLVR
jgi:Flp pilus assembly protein TadG